MSLTYPRHGVGYGSVLAAAAAIFALGFAAGRVAGPALRLQTAGTAATAFTAPAAAPDEAAPAAAQSLPSAGRQLVYPAEVIRTIDGDTFEAHVQVWPGLVVDTKVRLRGIDAPELHARCSDERVKAEAARSALQMILAEGGIAISRVGIDKYGGRVDAMVSTRNTADVSAALLNGGWARSYDGGRRGSWC